MYRVFGKFFNKIILYVLGKILLIIKYLVFIHENKLFKNIKKEYDQCFKGCFNEYKKKWL